MMKNSHEFSIVGNAAEKCCSNIGFGECACCNKNIHYSARTLKNKTI